MRILDFFKNRRSLSEGRVGCQISCPDTRPRAPSPCTLSFNLGESGSDQLIARRPDSEPPEFDITAMVDLVFMMNIYFLVTFVTVALGELNLPTAKHVSALDADSAVILTVTRSLDGKSVTLYLGRRRKR